MINLLLLNQMEHYYKGKLHRNDDKPAIIKADGSPPYYVTKMWYQNGELKRLFNRKLGKIEPDVIYSNGVKEWHSNSKLIKKL